MPVRTKRVPGEAGIWVMVLGDMVMFGLFFVTFADYRLGHAALFATSQAQLNHGIGLINTLLLLTSSLAVWSGVEFARDLQRARARRAIGVGIALGLGFFVMKTIEYHEKIAAGILPATNDFYTLYYGLTGIHLLHVVAGLGALAYMRGRVSAELTPATIAAIESCAIFWHLVDILWVILFAILYLHP